MTIGVSNVSVPFTSGSSLQRWPRSLDATQSMFQFPLHRDPRCNRLASPQLYFYLRFSSLYIGILAATIRNADKNYYVFSFSSLYIGILAATGLTYILRNTRRLVSVPFTSGSSLQRGTMFEERARIMFQFPLHRDPRCNTGPAQGAAREEGFQFPLHRDPRCNIHSHS